MDRPGTEASSRIPTRLHTRDGKTLAADLWLPSSGRPRGTVVINSATAVKASYYHRFARFLSRHDFAVLTYDYRDIGASRQSPLRHSRNTDNYVWGTCDCDAALQWAVRTFPDVPLHVVGHSIGGLMVGLAGHGRYVQRLLTVGSQYAYWRDYAADKRVSMWLRWHLLMPLTTFALGYFPAKRLGWHEDLPAAAAYEWAFRPATLEQSYQRYLDAGHDPLRHFTTMTGDILAIGLSDDPFGTPAALNRLLGYYKGAHRSRIEIRPESVGVADIGHFTYFHDRFETTLWTDAVRWLSSGTPPAAEREVFSPNFLLGPEL